MTCAPSEIFAVRMKKLWVLSYPVSEQQRLWSDWAVWLFAGRTGLIVLQLIYCYENWKVENGRNNQNLSESRYVVELSYNWNGKPGDHMVLYRSSECWGYAWRCTIRMMQSQYILETYIIQTNLSDPINKFVLWLFFTESLDNIDFWNYWKLRDKVMYILLNHMTEDM